MSRAAAHAAFVAALLLTLAKQASGADKLDTLARQLASSDDFRVRTQAALALGAAKNKRAVDPLCKGLDDSSTAVRAASAAALGKLKLGGGKCLERRLEDEPNASVKASIKKAIALIGSGSEPTITGATKYYVAIGKINNKTARDGGEIDKLVRSTMSTAAGNLDGYVIAPDDETTAQATKRLSKFKQLKAFYLLPKVLAPAYAGSKLTIKLDVAVFTYPGKALKGSFTAVKRTQLDSNSEDTGAEDDLIKAAAESALALFAKNAERFE
jgi:HEAT repeat protein